MAQIKKLSTELQPLDKLLDSSGDAGTSGQILSSTGSGTNWIANTGGSVTGTGADEQVTYWTGSSVIDGDAGFKYNKGASNNSIITLTSTGLQALSFVDSNSAYADAMSILRDSDKLSLTYGHNANEEAITIVGGTGSDVGYVGIGTNSPSDKLTVNGNLSIFGNKIYNGSAANSAGVSFPSSTTRIDGYNGITFHSSTTTVGSQSERMRITNNGNVGIGASNPLRKLHVVGNMAVNAGTGEYYGILMTGGESADPTITIGDWHNSSATIKWDSTGNYLRIDSQHSTANAPIVFSGNDATTEYMRINSSGNIGIGTSSPDNKLDVVVTDVNITPNAESSAVFRRNGNNYISILSNSSNWGGILFGEETDANDGALTYNHPSGYMVFEIRDAERMRINSSGNVGIGTTAPNEKLEVTGNIRASGSYKVGATDVITSGRRFYAAAATGPSSPAYSFSGKTDTGMYRDDHGSNDRIFFSIDGTARAYIDANGISSNATIYVSSAGSFRNYSGVWKATTGTSGNGFQFFNTADNSSAVLLSITSVASAATDSVATFSGKVVSAQTASTDGNGVLTTKSYVDGLVTGVTRYMGLWDASSGTGGNPDLTASTYKVPGYYFIVSVAGDAEPNGAGTEPDTWHVGDWVIWSDQATDAWQKIDNTSVLSGTGTANKLALWNGDESLTNSRFSQNATTNIITGPGNAASDKSLSVTSGAGTEQLYIQGTGEVVVTQNYFYVSASQGAYINGILRARGGVTDDGGTLGLGGNGAVNNLVLTSNTSATFAGNVFVNQGSDLTTQALQVNGFIDITDVTSTALRWYNGSTFRGGLGLDSWAHSGSDSDITMYISGDNSFHVSTNNVKRLEIDSSGATFAGDVVANGTIQTLASNANLTISGDTSGSIYYNNTAGEHRWRANGSSVNSMTLSSSLLTVNENATFTGNVGIGITSPSEKLEVGGPIVWNGSLIASQTSSGVLDRSGDNIRIRAYGASAGSGVLQIRTGGGGDNVDTLALTIDSSQNATFAGKIGIGTTPSAPLHIAGTSGSVGGQSILFNGNTAIWQPSDATLTIRPSGTDAATFSSTSTTFAGELTVGSSGTGRDVMFYGDLAGEYFHWDENVSTVNIYHRDELPGLEVYTSGGAQTTQPQLKVGRTNTQYWGAYVDDRNAHLVHRQDETTGTMTTRFDQWDSNTSDTSANWLWRHGNGTGGSMTNAAILYQSGDMVLYGDLLTDSDSTADLGKTGQRWANIWVDNINGGTPTTGGPYLPISAGISYPLTGDLYLDDGSGASPSIYLKNGSDNYWRLLNSSTGILTLKEGTTDRLTFAAGGNATFAGNITVIDGAILKLGTSGDLKIYHNGTDSYIENLTGELRIISNDWALRSATAQIIGYDTTDDYVKFNKDARWVDNEKAQFGTTSDLQIYHDGSNSYINDSGTGNLRIGGTQIDILNPDSNEFKARFLTDGAVELYHNNSKKFETTSTGISVTGVVADRDIPCLFNSNFLDGTASSLYVVPFNNNTETTISAKTYYHYVTIPYAGKLTRVTFKSVSGTPSTSSFTVQLFLYVNGTQQASSSEISWSSVNGITWSPTSSNTFSAGDEINIAYQKSASSRTMAGVAVGVAIELTDYDI